MRIRDAEPPLTRQFTDAGQGVSNAPRSTAGDELHFAPMDAEGSPPAGSFRITVFLPCHTLDDFPTWLAEAEADDLLAAWTAAWHPALVASAAAPPQWASVDLPPPDDGPILGIVPSSCDDRFAAQDHSGSGVDARWVRGTEGAEAMAAAAARELRCGGAGDEPLPGEAWAEDFRGLGLAVLLAELLARRMRSTADLLSAESQEAGFGAAVVAAARAAVAGRDEEVRAALQECFGWIESSRARYYPVDVWLIDLVLLAPATLGPPLLRELESPVPIGVVSAAALLPRLAEEHPGSLARLRGLVAEGRVTVCGGRLDERPLDACTPEEILESLARGRAAWQDHVGAEPTTFAQYAGGSSALLPQILDGLGYDAAVWSLFDGTRLPDPGAGRIRWEGPGAGGIEAVARPPLDARHARTILELPERIGDALDHDHTAVVTFAHHAGTAGRWHDLLRRIGGWSTALGTFVAPAEFFRRTAGVGTPVSFEPDAFPPTPPPAAHAVDDDPIAAAIDVAVAAARRIVDAAAALEPALVPAGSPVATLAVGRGPAEATSAAGGIAGVLARVGGWWSGPSRDADLVLESASVRLQPHLETGGILSLRRPGDRGNRISQQLAIRGTRSAAVGSAWESAEERATFTRMRADSVARGTTASGAEGIVSRGRLLETDGREAGRFTQGMSLAPGLPLVVLDVELELAAELVGPTSEQHAACRFAWHENEDVEIRRSLHTQSVVTERTRFTAPHFVEILGGGGTRGAATGPRDGVAILTGGLPWHVLSSPHVLDTILVAGGDRPVAGGGARSGRTVRRRLAVGIGLERPWDLAIEFLAHAPLRGGPATAAANVRLLGHAIDAEGGSPVRAEVGLLESAGLSGEVRIEWARPVARVNVRDLRGGVRVADVAIEGRATVLFLKRYEWLRLEVEFQAERES